jgi:aromatic amino acid transport protein AroP
MAMAVIMFSFGGLELVGITAAEADDPASSIPKATNQVIYRILIFYVGALAVLLSLFPWDKVQEGGSPFVMIFHALDSDLVATILNVVVLTAALSVYNSCVYCNSRMLLGLALQGNAPAALGRVNRRGIPVSALGVSALATASCVLLNYLMPGKAFGLLMALVVAALIINWAMISITHLRFRQAMQARGITPRYPSRAAPLTNYLCLAFMAGILVVMWLTPDTRISVSLIPAWLLLLWAAHALRRRLPEAAAEAVPARSN